MLMLMIPFCGLPCLLASTPTPQTLYFSSSLWDPIMHSAQRGRGSGDANNQEIVIEIDRGDKQ